MRFRSTLLLFLLVLLTGAAIWMLERETVGTREMEQQALRAVSVDPDAISALSLTTTNYSWLCRKQGIQWVFEEPITGFADSGEINRILTGLKNLPKRELISEEQRDALNLTLHDFGLEVPSATIVLEANGAQERTLLIGGTSVVGDSMYVMETTSRNVVATSPEVLDLLPPTLEAVRSRKLMPNALYAVRRIEIKRPNGFVLLVNEDDRGWYLQQPVISRADPAFVRDLLEKLTTAEISEFVEDDVSDFVPYGLDLPEAKISLWPMGSGTVRSIALGRADPSNPDLVYARVDDSTSVAEVSGQLLTDVGLDANVLRNRDLLDVAVDRVAYIRMKEGDASVELSRDDAGSWSLIRPVTRAADSSRIWEALETWTSTRIEQFVSDSATNVAEFGLSSPWRELVLSANRVTETEAEDESDGEEEGESRVTLRLFQHPEDEDSLYVLPAGSESLYKVQGTPFAEFPVDPLPLYDRTVLHLVPGDIRRIQSVTAARTHSVEQDGDGEWTVADEADEAALNGIILSIVAEVSDLRAIRFVADDPEEPAVYGLEEPVASLTLGLSGDAGISKTVLFGKPAGADGVYAKIRGQTTVFVLARAVQDRLLSDLIEETESAVEEPVVSPPIQTPAP